MTDNTISQQTLKLLKSALNPSDDDTIDLSRWDEIYKDLEMQTVLPLVIDVVACHLEDDNKRMKLYRVVANTIIHFHQLMTAQTKLVELLKENHIPVAIMKGAAAALYYPKPKLRQMGDIDILVLPEDFERAFHLLCHAGYRCGESGLEHHDPRHIPFWNEDGVEIELHRYFSSSDNEHQNTLLDHWLYDKLKTPSNLLMEKYQVPVFPTLENGLILLAHINHHLIMGLGLRQIIDWYYYASAELNDIFWENAFKAKAEAIGMAKLAMVVTKMCQKYLGLSENITWCKNIDEDLADELMAYVLRKGNFGRKIGVCEKRTISVMHAVSSVSEFFEYLTKTGLIHMKEAGLKPNKGVAWLYQIGHIMRMVIRQKGNVNLLKEIKTGAKETDLLKKLEVTRL